MEVGIADRTEQVFAAEIFAVCGDGQGDGAVDAGQLTHSFQHIGRVAQRVFQRLGNGVRRLGKGAEGGNVNKITLVELPHVDGRGDAAGDDAAGATLSLGRWRLAAKSLVVPAGR